jgi:hypothetical protein
VITRAQQGAEQLLGAAGLGQDAIGEVAGAIVRSATEASEPRPLPPTLAVAGGENATEPEQESSEPPQPSEPQP